ncbi:MAG: hypothetical protein JWR83_2861 [Aeromicrobium sp.]|nr:hypothetical protein [Aeromicrobium sp.]
MTSIVRWFGARSAFLQQAVSFTRSPAWVAFMTLVWVVLALCLANEVVRHGAP